MFSYFAKRRAAQAAADAAANDAVRLHLEAQAAERRLQREQELAALREEREHQLNMIRAAVSAVEALAEGQARAAETQSAALIKLAEASHAQANSFSEWLKSFQISSAPESSVVSEADEWRAEQDALRKQLGLDPTDDPEDVPEEFRLALELQRDFIASVRGDNTP